MSVPLGASMMPYSMDFGRMVEQWSKYTVRELISTTGGLSLATLVASRAAFLLLTLTDSRRFARIELVPPGGGTSHKFQKVTAVAPTASGELAGSGLDVEGSTTFIPNQDPTLTDVSATLKMFRIRTFIGDMAQRQAAVNLAEVVGIAHGNGINRDMNDDIYTTLDATATNLVTKGTAADGKSYAYTWNDIFDLVDLVQGQRGRADTLLTAPGGIDPTAGSARVGFYPFIRDNINSGAVTYTAALADYLRTGQLAEVFGLRIYLDPVYYPAAANLGDDGREWAHVLVSNEAVGWAQAEDIIAEIQRWAPSVGYQLVTHSIADSALVLEEHSAVVQHI